MDLNTLIRIIAFECKIPEKELYGKCRKRYKVEAKQIFMYIAHNRYRRSYSEIGRVINRNHATVIHGVKTIENLLQVDKKTKEKFYNIQKAVDEYEENKNPDIMSLKKTDRDLNDALNIKNFGLRASTN